MKFTTECVCVCMCAEILNAGCPDSGLSFCLKISLILWLPISVPRFTEFIDGHVILHDTALYPMYQTQRWEDGIYFRTQTSNTTVEGLWCTRDNQNQCRRLSFQVHWKIFARKLRNMIQICKWTRLDLFAFIMVTLQKDYMKYVPCRWTYAEFFQRYRVLAKSKDINRKNMRKTCENILVKLIEVRKKLILIYCLIFRN